MSSWETSVLNWLSMALITSSAVAPSVKLYVLGKRKPSRESFEAPSRKS